MKRLVLCFDGTWNAVNDPATVTNVVKFAQAVRPTASDGTKQIVYYNSGVGSGGQLDRIFGGLRLRPARQREARAGLPVAELRRCP
jgi:uncharacterized protein (DUF2235 family)